MQLGPFCWWRSVPILPGWKKPVHRSHPKKHKAPDLLMGPWNPGSTHQLRLVVYPMIYRVSYILDFSHQPYVGEKWENPYKFVTGERLTFNKKWKQPKNKKEHVISGDAKVYTCDAKRTHIRIYFLGDCKVHWMKRGHESKQRLKHFSDEVTTPWQTWYKAVVPSHQISTT